MTASCPYGPKQHSMHLHSMVHSAFPALITEAQTAGILQTKRGSRMRSVQSSATRSTAEIAARSQCQVSRCKGSIVFRQISISYQARPPMSTVDHAAAPLIRRRIHSSACCRRYKLRCAPSTCMMAGTLGPFCEGISIVPLLSAHLACHSVITRRTRRTLGCQGRTNPRSV